MTSKNVLAVAALIGFLALAGCSAPVTGTTASTGAAPTASPDSSVPSPKPTPADLVGEWVEENGGDSTQSATITGQSISINWVNAKDGTTAVYWVGSYAAPSAAGDFTWTSTRDEAATDGALLASTDPTKDFEYAGGKISYKVTAMGVTKTVTLIRK
ncbi:hypothetical protein [Microbacterium sp. 2MCAF23]|uniref:hypothetical protein n=1 Tax=Microbacterium sp. 2MCAF23 TaxID=3232985 RepID=UPI003F97A391